MSSTVSFSTSRKRSQHNKQCGCEKSTALTSAGGNDDTLALFSASSAVVFRFSSSTTRTIRYSKQVHSIQASASTTMSVTMMPAPMWLSLPGSGDRGSPETIDDATQHSCPADSLGGLKDCARAARMQVWKNMGKFTQKLLCLILIKATVVRPAMHADCSTSEVVTHQSTEASSERRDSSLTSRTRLNTHGGLRDCGCVQLLEKREQTHSLTLCV